jgi:ATP-dependent exoDNAse (exonuclease V) alpha subunit
LVVCATHDEIDKVTEAIRECRKQQGDLNGDSVLTRHVSLGWTAAQKADLQNYRSGMVLIFHRAVKGIARNEAVEVMRTDERRLTVRGADGSEKNITGKQARSFDVFAKRLIEVSVGDRLLLTGNRREPGLRLTNGELVTVSGVDIRGGVQLADSRILPASYRQFDYGYAVTAHRSQGKSVDSVIISADGMQKELFYVAASRGRHGVAVITSDKERLKQTVARSMARKSASELTRQACHGRCRGLAPARQLIRRAAALSARISRRLVRNVNYPIRERHQEYDLSR